MQKAASLSKIIPANARPFILRGLALVVGWNLLYKLLLAPLGTPDNQLTEAVQWATAKLLSLFYSNVSSVGHLIYIGNEEAITIASQCNGLELMVLYVGFIFCIPSTAKRMAAFSIVGIVTIYILNVIRCLVLAQMFYTNHSLANFAHHYAFKMIIYAVVFYGWVLYAKKSIKSEA